MIKIIIFICVLFNYQVLFSQEIKLHGQISDSTLINLSGANILAFPTNKTLDTKFAISNDQGLYTIKLKKGISYEIEISYLGYDKFKFNLKTEQNILKNITLTTSINQLDEVEVNYKIPVKVKQDSIIYNTDAFVNGEERKLQEILKKLPGIEVDREGNVKVHGKKITKVMVENKTFFTGNSKLAIRNIPADAVDQIEILDNYNDIGFLKGLTDSDEMAMNIKLKEDKKKFVFGDIEAGVGIKDRYLLHPTLFYYSPKTNINFIGDLNNTGVKSFTVSDYIEFEGGFGKLASDIRGLTQLYSDDFSKYLTSSNFKENTNQFGAFNLRQSLSSKTDLNAYIIANGSKTITGTQTLNEYNNNDPFIENRNTTETLNNFFILGKLTLDYEPSSTADISANTFIKLSNNNATGSILTNSPFQNNNFETNSALDAINLKQNLEYSKKFSKSQTISLETTLDYKNNRPTTNWISNESFLSNLIPLEDDSTFDVFQQKETQSTSFDFILKDYWVLNNSNHIYTSIGTNLVFEDYITSEEQRLSNGTTNDFENNGFGNDLTYQFNDIFLGLEYKFLSGIFTNKAGIFYHNYTWQNEQLNIKTSKSTTLLLPQLSIEAEFNSSKKLNFKYQVKANFPNSPKLIGNFLLSNFNQVFRGNIDLANEKYHSLSLNYYKFSLFRGLNLNASIFYNKKTQSIKNTTALEGIEQFRTLTLFNLPENSLTGRFSYGKKINKIKYTLEADGNYNEFFQIVNDNTSKNISKTLNSTGKIETFFEKSPNI